MNRDALLLLSVMLVAPILSGCGLIYDYDNRPPGYGGMFIGGERGG